MFQPENSTIVKTSALSKAPEIEVGGKTFEISTRTSQTIVPFLSDPKFSQQEIAKVYEKAHSMLKTAPNNLIDKNLIALKL